MTAFACARCGTVARYDDTYLCNFCIRDRKARIEQADAEDTFPGDYKAQRALLIKSYGWAGWHRHLKGASRA